VVVLGAWAQIEADNSRVSKAVPDGLRRACMKRSPFCSAIVLELFMQLSDYVSSGFRSAGY